MSRILSACAIACVLSACTDLPPLDTCGNGIVEATAGEDCDDPDPAVCAACRLVCDADLGADGACADGARCCLAGQRCGVDHTCRAPSGRFASPTGAIPFNATQIGVADVDGDGIGDAFGVNRQAASFLFGTATGDPTRTGTAPIPTLSRAESQVVFITDGITPDAPVSTFGSSGLVLPTARGFAVLVANAGRLTSPPLPELELDEGVAALAASPADGDQILTVVADKNAHRLAIRAFVDRALDANDPSPCGQTFAVGDADVVSHALLDVASVPAGEFAAVSVIQVQNGALVATGLCVYPTPLAASTPPVVFPLGVAYAPAVRIAQLDGDLCPEVVAEIDDDHVDYFDTAPDPGGDCVAAGRATIADGHLLGVGDLTLDAGGTRDEVVIGRYVYRSIAGGPVRVVGLELPEALTRAVVVDINRDEAPDLVAVGGGPDLTVVLAVPTGYAPRTIASIGNLGELVTADFDADTFPDVATVEVLADNTRRPVVAFGGPFGPQGFDSVGAIDGARSLSAFVDRRPLGTSDAFADLVLVNTNGIGHDEVSQFNGSGTRALTSEIDLSADPPSGDGGQTFGRTMAHGEILPPAGDGEDFCAVSLEVRFGPSVNDNAAYAFCVGGQGVALAAGELDTAGGFATGDPVDPGDTMPLVAAAQVVGAGGTPIPVLVAVRRDTVLAPPDVIVMGLPAFSQPPAPTIGSVVLHDLFTLPTPPTPSSRLVFAAAMRAVELDGDPDSELLITLLDFQFDAMMPDDGTFTPTIFRVDLAAAGNTITASPAVPLVDQATRHCGDATFVELGTELPDGAGPSLPGPELVVLCVDDADDDSPAHLYALYRTEAGLAGPFEVGAAGAAFGAIAAGDLTGDRLDDLVILDAGEGDNALGVMAQCPAHDLSACAGGREGDR